MAAPRRPQNRGLERNLHTHPLGGYRYRRPDRSYAYLGKDRAKANEAARKANLFYAENSPLFDKIVGAPGTTPLADFVESFISDKLSKEDIADETRKNRVYTLRKIAKRFGNKDVAEISRRELSEYLISLESDWARQAHRVQLVAIFDAASAQGFRDDNPAVRLERAKAKRSRSRLDYEGFLAIRACAEPWLQNAMDLALQTLQRPDDLVSLRWDQDTGSHLQLAIQKTGKRIAIPTTPKIREIVNRCRDGIGSPYILHRRPEKARPRELRSAKRNHHAQILRTQLSRAFARARDASGRYEGVSNPPSFYEIKSLGGALYREMGWSVQRVQALMGHRKAQMTEHYLNGHELPYEPVDAGLEIPAMR